MKKILVSILLLLTIVPTNVLAVKEDCNDNTTCPLNLNNNKKNTNNNIYLYIAIPTALILIAGIYIFKTKKNKK